jgi:hypothetical protein
VRTGQINKAAPRVLEHHPRALTDHYPSTTRSHITLADRAGVLMARVSDRLRLPAARLTAHDAGDDVRLVDDCERRVPALQRAGSAGGTTCVESVCGAYSRDWNTCVCLLGQPRVRLDHAGHLPECDAGLPSLQATTSAWVCCVDLDRSPRHASAPRG